jgi:hypothetical protein
MSATVICFQTFRLQRDRQRGEGAPDTLAGGGAEPRACASAPFLRQPGVALTARQIAHRQTMLDYWNRRRRAMFGLFTDAGPTVPQAGRVGE